MSFTMIEKANMRHDGLFKAVFGHPEYAAAALRGLMPRELADAVDWTSLEMVSGSYVDENLAGLHNDLVFSARLGEDTIFFIFEHQSTNDQAMVFRLSKYKGRIWDRYWIDHKDDPFPFPPIVAVVLSHASEGWTAPQRFSQLFRTPLPAGYAPFIPDFGYIVDDLNVASNEDLLARALPALPKLALWLFRDGRDPAALIRNLVD